MLDKGFITGVLMVMVAVIGASLFEHMVLAPRMEHSPGKTTPASTAIPINTADWVKVKFPNATTV